MRIRYFFPLFVLFSGMAFSGEPSGRVADLQPELKQALTHDDACFKVSTTNASDQLLESPVDTQQIFTGGREAGVIASPQDDCDCRSGNCSTFVYLKSGDSYTLALQHHFSSLKPMKIVKHGLPSLSGKFQVGPAEEETTVYDWSGKEYQPSLCATVVQRKNVRLPSISRHPCKDR
ncbi:MAG TPA: hypothetical protein VN679_10345 [Candidatus Acidoferrales bacterium]|nr:hypothetical protein [Candidatus Acidoferrales bacterium]